MSMEEEDDAVPRAVAALQLAWMNEKNAPELLPHASDSVDIVASNVQEQEEAAAEGAFDSESTAFMFNVYQSEIERIRFLLTSYHRTRLHKIEQFAPTLLADKELQQRMSPAELAFCHGLEKLFDDHASTAFLRLIPDSLRRPDDVSAEPNANLDRHCFARFQKTVGALDLTGDADAANPIIINPQEDDVFLLRYATVSELLDKGDVVLL